MYNWLCDLIESRNDIIMQDKNLSCVCQIWTEVIDTAVLPTTSLVGRRVMHIMSSLYDAMPNEIDQHLLNLSEEDSIRFKLLLPTKVGSVSFTK